MTLNVTLKYKAVSNLMPPSIVKETEIGKFVFRNPLLALFPMPVSSSRRALEKPHQLLHCLLPTCRRLKTVMLDVFIGHEISWVCPLGQSQVSFPI